MYNKNIVLKAVRENQNVKPEDIAERLNIPENEYLKLENGEKQITIDTAKKLGKIFNIDPEYFFVRGTQAVNYNSGTNSHGGPFYEYHNENGGIIEMYEQLRKENDELKKQVNILQPRGKAASGSRQRTK